METVRKITKESSREDPFHDNILTKPEVNAKERDEEKYTSLAIIKIHKPIIYQNVCFFKPNIIMHIVEKIICYSCFHYEISC